MRRGYIRLSKAGPSLEEQKNALARSGIEDFSVSGPVHVDTAPKRRTDPVLPGRSEAISCLEAGDELVVANAARLGTSAVDALEALQAIALRGAAVRDAETGELISLHPDAMKAIDFARRAESGNRREIAAKMKQARHETGRLGGAPEKFDADALAEARRLWADPELSSAEVARRVGINVRTLYRRLGDRGGKKFGS